MFIAFAGLLICGCCGAAYRRKTWQKRRVVNSKSRLTINSKVWRCITKVKNEKYCSNDPSFQEDFIENAILKSIETTQAERKGLISTLTKEIRHTTLDIMKYANTKVNVEDTLKRIDVLQKELTQVIDTMSSSNFSEEDNQRISELSAEIMEERKSLDIDNEVIYEIKLDTHINELAIQLEEEYNIT